MHAERGPSGSVATTLYLIAALVFTWPLVLGLSRDIPWDLGDSLLNAWILAWDAEHLKRLFSGDLGAMRGFWNANIFYPEPLTLAYSEHLFAQAAQIFPIYALTGNIILCYNLLFLSTFVLSGLGMYLFVREVTGSPRAGFVAGLIYAFAPLRVPQFAHLQVISSQWMPFALYGFRRYFEKRRPLALAGAGAALVAQNLSCGYFLMFFAPVVLAYVLFEIATRRLWTDLKMWGALSATACGVAAATLPFLMPYLELRRLGFPPRALSEVEAYSADVMSYWTSPAESRVWGRLIRGYPKAEGDLFPGLSTLLLASIGAGAGVAAAWQHARSRRAAWIGGLIPLTYALTAGCAMYLVFVVLILTGNGFAHLGPVEISVLNLNRNLRVLLILLAALLVVSPRARAFARGWTGSVSGFAVIAALLTAVLSLGPEIRTSGKSVAETSLYYFLYADVPGFDGLRVPARYGMLAMLFLSISAGFGASMLEARARRGALIALAVGLIAIGESFAAPIVVNGTGPEADFATPPDRMFTGENVPAVYRHLASLPSPATVVVEFPFNQWTYELRYVFYSAVHWHPLLNGYSGTFPLSYDLRSAVLRNPTNNPDGAWEALVKSGATHAVVHGNYYKDGRGRAVSDWLTAHGASLTNDFDGDKVFALK